MNKLFVLIPLMFVFTSTTDAANFREGNIRERQQAPDIQNSRNSMQYNNGGENDYEIPNNNDPIYMKDVNGVEEFSTSPIPNGKEVHTPVQAPAPARPPVQAHAPSQTK